MRSGQMEGPFTALPVGAQIGQAEGVVRTAQRRPRGMVQGLLQLRAPQRQARGIGLKLVWMPSGSVDFAFDAAALDLVITNLLDNARKYALFNRDIEVGVENEGPLWRLWVEDLGLGIP